VGGVIMMHGDERGLRLPPGVAPPQVVVIPIQTGDARVLEAGQALAAGLRATGIRVKVDDRDHVRPGAKFFEWELKGAPIRIELGTRELAGGEVSVARRDREQRERLLLDGLAGRVQELLGDIHQELYDRAAAHLAANTRRLDDRAELIEYLKAGSGFAVTAWCGSPECEASVKAETSATLRCLPLEPEDPGAPCAVCGRPGAETATWGQAY
jgi:prolyl-tRNA synthetase